MKHIKSSNDFNEYVKFDDIVYGMKAYDIFGGEHVILKKFKLKYLQNKKIFDKIIKTVVTKWRWQDIKNDSRDANIILTTSTNGEKMLFFYDFNGTKVPMTEMWKKNSPKLKKFDDITGVID